MMHKAGDVTYLNTMQRVVLVFAKKTCMREANTKAVLAGVAAVGGFARVAANVGSAERFRGREVVLCIRLLHHSLPNSQKILSEGFSEDQHVRSDKHTDTAWDILISVAACFFALFSSFSAFRC
jgi:hypothetical protein